MRSSLSPLRLALFASLGLVAGACSGSTTDPGAGAAGAGGTSGGTSSGGAGQSAAGTTAAGAPATGGSDGDDGDDTSAHGGSGPIGACASPTPILTDDGTDTGFVRCGGGSVDRVTAVAHAFSQPDDPTCATEVAPNGCKMNTDCSGMNAFCGSRGAGTFGCACLVGCASDADCNDGTACVPSAVSGTYSHCATAGCRTDADCASGRCGLGPAEGPIGCGGNDVLACRTPSDPCETGTQCASAAANCAVGTNGFECYTPTSVCGRPLLVDGSPRVAARTVRSDWNAALAVETSALTGAERAALARHWTEVAALEHASIASFSRFALQLLALGAPAALVDDAAAATKDEIEHARISYALASTYARSPVGPAPLSLAGVRIATDRREVVEGLLREGCVGETVGAAEARTAAENASDPALRAALTRIADDETRHAALAWKTLAWVLDDADAELRAFVATVLEDAIATLAAEPLRERVAVPTHGLLAVADVHAVRREALAEVVRPCAAACGWLAA